MDDRENAAENPYAAPPIDADLAMVASPFASDLSQDEQIRHQYLSHEAEVRSLGTLYVLGACLCGIMTSVNIVGFGASLEMINSGRLVFYDVLYQFATLIIIGLFTALFFFSGIGLRRLEPWSRISSVIISAIGLLLFPVGTLIGVYLLYLLLSRKAKVIFSDEYRQIIERTRHIKYKDPLIVKIILGTLLAILLLGILAIYLQTL